jgi:hypothetical protein
MTATIADPDAWKLDGLCRQNAPDAWFPGKGGSTRQVKAICADCPVRAECLEYALGRDERFGVWGGLSTPERRKLRSPAPLSRAPHRHPARAVNPVRLACSCGLPDCKGMVSKTTLQRHAERVRRLAPAQVAA